MSSRNSTACSAACSTASLDSRPNKSISAHGILSSEIDVFKNFVSKANHILISTHENPDADAYGSSCGLGLALRKLGKQVAYVNSSPVLSRLDFIPSTLEYSDLLSPDFKPDSIIICDCGSLSRVGDKVLDIINSIGKLPVLNIDHHASNDLFGTENIVVVEASSTAEVICALLNEAQLDISEESAVALYSGILADSGSFRYSCVRPYTFEAASICVSKGARPFEIAQQMFSRNSIERTRLHAQALLEMQLHVSGRVAFVITSADMIKRFGASISDSDGLAEQARDIDGVIVSALFKEDISPSDPSKSLWRISLRSKSALVDVSALSQKFGGGGHKAAAAFRSLKSKDEISSSLLTELENLISKVNFDSVESGSNNAALSSCKTS